ncbi:toll/interleukin-1 receptor domain-containing protein [Candidatus Thiosymbion oneisti]|uniref:toll/interleukin-1 receptor domain-containing protein n=1 Tax=Candidatus Thiosymbion oneisti TaxID=589554 RepID=UPI00159F0F18|nr:toll/interleukin-1 receptor domain-containing protein [Candidatus Thiosymbion oneisti]
MSQSVFISYSRLDRAQCAALRKNLEDCGIRVQIDEISIEPGSSLRDSIRRLIEASDWTICLVSAHSLRSFWVIWEIHRFVETLSTERFLPAYLDQSFLQDRFVGDVQREVSERQQALASEMQARLEQNRSVDDLAAIHDHLNRLANELPAVVRRLRELCTIDLTPRNFEAGFGKFYRHMTGEGVPLSSITTPDSLENASYAERRRRIEDHIATNELQEAAAETMDLLRQFFSNDRDAVNKATHLSGQIRQLSEIYERESKKPGPMSFKFLNEYNKQVFDYADELLGLIPPELSDAA